MMCGGNIRVSDERPIPIRKIKPNVVEGSIQFLVTQAMVPACRLLVYYLRKDGETVADSMVVDIEDKLENQVTKEIFLFDSPIPLLKRIFFVQLNHY